MSTKDEQIVKVEGVTLVREGGKQAIYAVDTTPGEAGRPCTLLIAPEGSTQVPQFHDTSAILRAILAKIEQRRDEGESDLRQIRNDIQSIAAEHSVTL